jgi:hypothetical protein
MSTQSIHNKVFASIVGHGRGWVFTPSHFSSLGTPPAVGMVLKRLIEVGTIRQLARGLYDYPAKHPQLGEMAPSVDAVAKALAGRDAIRLQPSGAYAANLLGLSDQVPMKIVFLTDGTTKRVALGKQTIILKRTTPRNMAPANKISGLVIQALRHLGQRHLDDSIVQVLQNRLTDDDKKQILKDLRFAPAWIAAIMRKVAKPVSY